MSTLEPCSWCGAPAAHYMTHICAGCTCSYTETSIPGEPQMGTYYDAEPDLDCPVHFPVSSFPYGVEGRNK